MAERPPEYSLAADACPACGHRLDSVANLTGCRRPQEGDYSVCIGCVAVLRFGAGLELSCATDAELAGALPETREALLRTQAAVRLARALVRPPGPRGEAN